jgi:hypothetical protein
MDRSSVREEIDSCSPEANISKGKAERRMV